MYVSKALDSRCFSCSGTVWKIYFSCIFRWFQSRFNTSQALERYKLKAECLFLICLGLLFARNCSFWYVLRFLILNLLRLQDAWTAYDRRAGTKEERKRTRTTKRYTSNSLKLVEEDTPQILFLDTNRLLFLRMSYFKWMHISKKWFNVFSFGSLA